MKIHIDTEKKKIRVTGNSNEIDMNSDNKTIGMHGDNFEVMKLCMDTGYHFYIKVIDKI